MKELSESIKNRIAVVKDFDDFEELRKNLCPFYEGGGCPDCRACSKKESDLETCRESYLEHIYDNPMEVWEEAFDAVLVKRREKVSLEEVYGIGINCNNCYMSDKCPLYKADYACGIEWGDRKPQTPEEYMQFLIHSQYERVKRSSVFEKLDGGVPDMGLSTEMDRLSTYIQNHVYLRADRVSVNIEATRTNNEGGGILAQLFGGGKQSLSEPKKELPAAEEAVIIEEVKPVQNDNSSRTSKRSQRKRQEVESA